MKKTPLRSNPQSAIDMRDRAQAKAREKARTAKRASIKQVSSKHAAELQEYHKVRAEYLAKHPNCEIFPDELATEIHHRRGRLGAFLTNTRYFMAVGANAHRLIHANPAWAHQQGYLLSRG